MTNEEKTIDEINKEFQEHQEKGNSTGIDPNYEKERRAMIMIEEVVTEKLKPLQAQIDQLPKLVQDTVINVIQQLQQQQQQTTPQTQQQGPPPPQDIQSVEKIQTLASLAPVLEKIFGGNSQQQANPSNVIMDMIVQSYMKRMQMDIDAQFMNTYQTPVNPPTWIREQNVAQKPSVEVE
jgi:hypothetical protein